MTNEGCFKSMSGKTDILLYNIAIAVEVKKNPKHAKYLDIR